MSKKLRRSFFSRMAVTVAEDLIGKELVFGPYRGIITETEAYRGSDDPASHSFRGPTPRSAIMFNEPGYSYIYLIYGMYHCLNVVTEPKGSPSAVLIRGLQLQHPAPKLIDGPGKLCRELGLTLAHNGIDLIHHPDFYICEHKNKLTGKIKSTPRIGIKVGLEKFWRFIAS